MTALLQYQALDKRGDEILDELEEQGESSRRYPVNVREFFLAVEGKGDLDPALDEIDSDWRDHVRRVTAPEPPVVTRFDERPPGTPPGHRAIGERPLDADTGTVAVYLAECPPGNAYEVTRETVGDLADHPDVVTALEDGAERVIVCPPGLSAQRFEELKDALPKPNVDFTD